MFPAPLQSLGSSDPQLSSCSWFSCRPANLKFVPLFIKQLLKPTTELSGQTTRLLLPWTARKQSGNMHTHTHTHTHTQFIHSVSPCGLVLVLTWDRVCVCVWGRRTPCRPWRTWSCWWWTRPGIPHTGAGTTAAAPSRPPSRSSGPGLIRSDCESSWAAVGWRSSPLFFLLLLFLLLFLQQQQNTCEKVSTAAAAWTHGVSRKWQPAGVCVCVCVWESPFSWVRSGCDTCERWTVTLLLGGRSFVCLCVFCQPSVCVCVCACVCVYVIICVIQVQVFIIDYSFYSSWHCTVVFLSFSCLKKKEKTSMCNVFAAMSSKLPPKIPTKWNWGYVLSAESRL